MRPEVATRAWELGIGRWLTWSLRKLLNDMTELRDHKPSHRKSDGFLGPRQREDRFAADGTGGRPAEHRGGANLLEADHPKKFAEAVEPFLEQADHRLERAVPRT